MTFLRRGAIVLSLTLAVSAGADIFSPGPLARPHANLEGLPNCTKCHPAGSQLSQEACLACHTELKPEIAKGAGYHGHMPNEKRACENCHKDHQGLDHQLINWGSGGQKGFQHQRTGWPLKGAHLKLECNKCHEKRYFTDKLALKLLEKKPVTWLGLSQSCESCHFDEHRGQLEGGCDECHDEKAWKPASFFEHGKTNYPLLGAHAKVKCGQCHPTLKDEAKHGFPAPVSATYFKAAPIDHDACTDCHKDPHDGKFGAREARCQNCHTVEGWMIIRDSMKDRAFHQKTRFPLKGAHVDVDCKFCHGPLPGQPVAKFKNLAFKECLDCHPDAHEAQLADRGKKMPDCDTCHTLETFSPPSYTVEAHQKTRYPLEGAHTVVACSDCHAQTASLAKQIPARVQADLKKKRRKELFSLALFTFTKPLDRCETCHADEHKGQFKDKACTTCHQVAAWSKLLFDHEKDSRYPLVGKHAQVPCAKCHWPPAPGQPAKYKPLETKCAACHEDAHAGQMKGQCEDCHTPHDWHRVEFDHQPPHARFALDGQHAKLKCDACHKPVDVQKGAKVVRYKPLPLTCEGCHSDFHQGAFRGFEP